MIELYEPQQKAVSKLVHCYTRYLVALNASATGTGKTLVALETARQLGVKPLIVAPLAAHATWWNWAREQGVALLDVVNVEKLRTHKTKWVSAHNKYKHIWNIKPDTQFVIIDEMHRGLTGPRTKTGAMCAMLRPQKVRTLLMSATPFNSPLNMRTSGYLLGLHRYSKSDFFNWCRRHGCTNSPFHRGLEFKADRPSSKAHLKIINEALKDHMVRLTIEGDLKEYFPENVVQPHLINLSERDVKEAEQIYADMEQELRKTSHVNPLVAMLRARQRVELLAVPAIAEMIQDSLEEGLSVYVAQSFLDSIKKLEEELERLGIASCSITGATPQIKRNAYVSMFQADLVRVLITSEAGGLSISLHQENEDMFPRTSIIRPTYKADVLVQELGRIHRASGGNLHPVLQRIVLCAQTIEERVFHKLQAKISNIDTLTDSDLV